ncbi:MAG: phosphoadenylyl-sulfate reductase [Ilumatobacteraceae bacterium]
MNARILPSADTFEAMHPDDVLGWAHREFGDGLVVTCSFADAVLPHLVSRAAPGAAVVLLDTQYLFAETWWFARSLARDLDLNLVVVEPEVEPDDRWRHDVEGCCHVRKVEPLQRALAGRAAWVTGLRRAESPTRAGTPIVSHDLLRDIVKINPLAAWTDEDMVHYVAQELLPEHPLASRGYPSIGCWPCTRPVEAGADPRSGRWADSTKTECGLHA